MNRVSRRRFLQLLGGGGAVALSGCTIGRGPDDEAAKTPSLGRPSTPSQDVGRRVLFVVELTGGNDGLATLVPVGEGRYRDLRGELAFTDEDVLDFEGGFGLHRGLAPLRSQLAVVQGVGVGRGDLSHFAMMQRWWKGDPDGSADYAAGFFGRCCDVLYDGKPLLGASLAGGTSPALVAERAPTLALPSLEVLRTLSGAEREPTLVREALAVLAGGKAQGVALDGVSREGVHAALEMVASLRGVEPGNGQAEYPGGPLSDQFRSAAALIRADAGLRVLHLPWGDFDTHSGQRGRHDALMTEFGKAVAAFLADLARSGDAGRVLVATISEFGRRVAPNAGGTDHGAASVAMLVGPVVPGLHGEAPSLDRLDPDGNLVPTLPLGDYYATLAESWLGVPAGEVLPKSSVRAVEGVISR